MLTAAGTGLRWGELAGLGPASVDLLHRRLFVDRTLVDIHGEVRFGDPKTRGSRRSVSLPSSLIGPLSEQLGSCRRDLVFTSPNGDPLRRSNFYHRIWKPAVRAAELGPQPGFRDLRHSHVALLIAAGVPVKAIQERLGQASIVMTMTGTGTY